MEKVPNFTGKDGKNMQKSATAGAELLKILRGDRFDPVRAAQLVQGCALNTPLLDENGYKTTYLNEAVRENHLEAVRFLLAHGADPNYSDDWICPLFELQFCEQDQDAHIRYEIAKLFLQYGADPNLEWEGESIYDEVTYEVYNNLPELPAWRETLMQFYKLLVLSGGGREDGRGYHKAALLHQVDVQRPDDYAIRIVPMENQKLAGYLIDQNGEIAGEL